MFTYIINNKNQQHGMGNTKEAAEAFGRDKN